MKKLSDDEIRVLIAQRQKLYEKSQKLVKQSGELRRKIEDGCQHTEIDIERKYYPGGYDYVSTVTVKETCKLCGKVFRRYDDPTHRGSHD